MDWVLGGGVAVTVPLIAAAYVIGFLTGASLTKARLAGPGPSDPLGLDSGPVSPHPWGAPPEGRPAEAGPEMEGSRD